jgi:hypothetical protein
MSEVDKDDTIEACNCRRPVEASGEVDLRAGEESVALTIRYISGTTPCRKAKVQTALVVMREPQPLVPSEVEGRP